MSREYTLLGTDIVSRVVGVVIYGGSGRRKNYKLRPRGIYKTGGKAEIFARMRLAAPKTLLFRRTSSPDKGRITMNILWRFQRPSRVLDRLYEEREPVRYKDQLEVVDASVHLGIVGEEGDDLHRAPQIERRPES